MTKLPNCQLGLGFRVSGFGFWLALLAALFSLRASAVSLTEPINMLYGFIVISNVPAGPDRPDLVIEARRTTNGAPIASYRMGSESRYGDAYFLEIPIVTAATNDPANATVGTLLYITLRDEVSDLAQVTFQVNERGRFQRLDFIIGPLSDTNGLPDSWEIAHFGVPGQNPNADPDHDGLSNLQEYLLGTDPMVADSFKVNVTNANSQVLISFFARRAEGTGYEGKARYYSLESSTNVGVSSAWRPVSNYTNIFGNNSTIVFLAPGTNSPPVFYRGRATLTP